MRACQKVSVRRSREGAAFLLLVLMVLLVVAGATGRLVRSELVTRRGEADRWRAKTMLAAIDAVRQSGQAMTEPIRLPLDSPTDSSPTQSIEVTFDESAARITARWYRGNRIVDTMSQKIESKMESEP